MREIMARLSCNRLLGFEGFKILLDDVADECSFTQAALLGEAYERVVFFGFEPDCNVHS